jgi:RimJ/RimL family protein N-acetyltransferase
MNIDITLYGSLVVLRSLLTAEIRSDQYKNWLIDPRVTRYMSSGQARPTDEEMFAYEKSGLLLGIFRKNSYDCRGTTDLWMGNVRLHQINTTQRVAELGIMIGDKARWGQGYATDACTTLLNYAFQKMNLHRVGIGVVCKNQGGLALWTKLGFREEGRLREAFWVDGKACDVIRMGLLQREWFNEDSRRSSSAIG